MDIFRNVDLLLRDWRSAPDADGDELDAALATAAGLARVAWHLARCGSEDTPIGLNWEDPRDALAMLELTDALSVAASKALMINTKLQEAASTARLAPLGLAGPAGAPFQTPMRAVNRPMKRRDRLKVKPTVRSVDAPSTGIPTNTKSR